MTKTLNRRGALACAVLMALAVAAPLALSQSTSSTTGQTPSAQGHFRGHHGFGMQGGREFRQLNLSDDQKAQLKQIRTNHRDSTKALREQLRASMKQFHDSMKSNTFDEALVTQKLTETAPLRAKLMADSFKMRQEMSAVLTADQKAKLDQLRQQGRARREELRQQRTPKQTTQE